ncbi:TonB-dependent receptor [Aurantiacibacter xanthus]|uniref:TonB-dependent receptor n=1 Tax=Aurantiacibacter xanthus TaxID=1784712 RepID=A0A3A1P1P6_9SPHN|nr:TonB-dependent receptor [Aurantiacibacter xanthus]RIV82634.1 TonB-dependent receptor [Aurantiacibacter xanthus]
MRRLSQAEARAPAAHRSIVRKSLVLGTALTLLAAPSLTHAQEEDDSSVIIVTGSYLGDQGVTPTQILSREDLTTAPRASVGELLTLSPEFSGNAVYGDVGNNNQSPGAYVNLRGLGPSGTLVLLNGNRIAPTSEPDRNGNFGVDVNTLAPSIMIERVEVLKGGATGLYGSDAVAGVVNFVTRDRFEGLEVDASYQATDHGGHNELVLGAIMGVQSERGSLVAAIEYMDRNEYDFQSQPKARDFVAANPSLSTFGNPGSFQLLPGQSYNATVSPGPLPRFVADPNCTTAEVEGGGNLTGLGAPYNQICGTEQRAGREAVTPQERLVASIRGSFDLSEALEIGAALGFAKTSMYFDPSTGFPITSQPFVPAANPYNPFGGDVRFRGRFEVDGFYIDGQWWNASTYAKGDLGDGWGYQASFTWSENRVDARQQDLVRTHFINALNGLGGANCDPATGTPGVGPCQYLNVFASRYLDRPNDPELVNYVRATQLKQNKAQLMTWQGVVTGDLTGKIDLPGGGVQVALGYERRHEKLSKDVDPLTEGGDWLFVVAETDFAASRNFDAVFGEIQIPLLPEIDIQAAGRFTSFEGHESFDPQVGVRVRPNPQVELTGTYSTSFRAPDLRRIYGVGETDATGINVPGINAPATNGIVIPNADLGPEEAESWTAGITANPIDGLQLSATYWTYNFNGIAVQESPQSVVQAYADSGGTEFADRLVFDPVSQELVQLYLQSINAAEMTTSGIDMSADYSFDVGSAGVISLTANATVTTKYSYRETDDGPVIDALGRNNAATLASAMPEWRANAGINWSLDGHFAQATLRYIDGLIATEYAEDDPKQNTDGQTVLDLFYSYTFDLRGKTTVRLGVNNVFNELPAFQGASLFAPYVAGVYNPRGRQFVLGVNKAF